MPIKLDELDIAERGAVLPDSGDQPTSDPAEIRRVYVRGEDYKIPEIQAVNPYLNFCPVYQFQTQRHLLGLQERLDRSFRRSEALQKRFTEQRNTEENSTLARQSKAWKRRQLDKVFRAQDKAFNRYFSFICLINTVYGREKPSKMAMIHLKMFYKNFGLALPEPLEKLDIYQYRMLEPTRGDAENRLFSLLNSRWVRALLSPFKDRQGNHKAGGGGFTVYSESLAKLAEGIVRGAVVLLVVLGFVLITFPLLSRTAAVVVCLVLAVPFGALMMLFRPETYWLAIFGFLALMASLLQSRGGL